jgi:hypothetical protein
MANPNIVNVSDIRGKTAVLAVTTTAAAIVTNTSGSGKVYKINSLYIANIDGTSAQQVTVDVFRSSVAYPIGSTLSVPADATLIMIDKNANIYLEEGDALRLTAGADNDLVATVSYEEIS